MSNNLKSCLFKVPIFSHLNDEEQKNITNLIKVKKIKKGEILYNTSEEGSFLYIVNSGKIKVSKYTEDGYEQVIRILGHGDFAGEQALFTKVLTDDFAIGLEDTTMCVLEGSDLKVHMENNPEISFRIINELTKRLFDTEEKLKQSNLMSAEQRIAESIIKLSEDKVELLLPISKQDWASMLGMSTETLSRNLKKFKNNSIIDLEGQRVIKIKNKELLKEILY